MKRRVSILAAAILCAACSQGPSNADVDKAVREQYAQINSLTAGTLGDALGIEIHSVKSLGCKAAANSPGYNCDVELDASLPFVGRQTSVVPARLVKASDGWRLVQMQ